MLEMVHPCKLIFEIVLALNIRQVDPLHGEVFLGLPIDAFIDLVLSAAV